MKRLTLSGRNDQHHRRTVYLDDKEIGEVRPIHSKRYRCWLWEALDTHGHSHGDHWIKDWYAAEALTRTRPTHPHANRQPR
jgi:hypothetical protein